MLVEIVDKTNVQVSTYYFSVLQAQAAGFFKYNWYFLDFSRYSSTGVSVYFTLTDFFFIAFQYVSAKFSERILSFSSLVKKFCQFFLTSEAFFPFSSLVKAFSHLK